MKSPLPQKTHSPSPRRHRLKQPVRKECAAVDNADNSDLLLLLEQPLERKIGNTTYILTSTCSPNARETLFDKLWRLIKNDEATP